MHRQTEIPHNELAGKAVLHCGIYSFICLFVFLFSISRTVSGQALSRIIHQPEYDSKPVRFGYFVGLGASHYRVKHNDLYLSPANDTIRSITSPLAYGLKLGGMMNFNLNERYDFRIVPTVAIYSRKIEVNENPDLIKSRDQAWFEIPLLLRYKSLRRGNYRMNMFVGLSPGFETNAVNLVNRKKLDRVEGLRRADLSIEYGAGAEFFRRFFKLAPEVRFSHGIRNMINKNPNATQLNAFSYLSRLNTNTVTFYLFFE
jgi:hypothetical protein